MRLGEEYVPLELHGGTIGIDDFITDEQTAYACLNYAYDESKVNKQGDLVEFRNELSADNIKSTAKLHSIRNSINNEFEGFYLLYQPVVDAKTERLIGAEALLIAFRGTFIQNRLVWM